MRLQISGSLLLWGRICAFLRREREFGRLLSNHWIKVLFPLQWLITTTENERKRGRERRNKDAEILEEDILRL